MKRTLLLVCKVVNDILLWSMRIVCNPHENGEPIMICQLFWWLFDTFWSGCWLSSRMRAFWAWFPRVWNNCVFARLFAQHSGHYDGRMGGWGLGVEHVCGTTSFISPVSDCLISGSAEEQKMHGQPGAQHLAFSMAWMAGCKLPVSYALCIMHFSQVPPCMVIVSAQM